MSYENFITPEKLIYKYRSTNLNTFKILINSELYFSPPKDFNDPFDSRFKLTLDELDVIGVKSFYKSTNLNSKEINDKIKLFKKDRILIIKEIEENYNAGLTSDLGVNCFNTKKDEILMWAHYADNFKGICLIFDWKVHTEYFQGLVVQYKKVIPIINYDGNGIFDAGEILLTKLKSWEYENEVRSIVKLDEETNLAKFNPKALIGIIFGNKINLKDKETIKKLIQLHPSYNEFDFYNAIPDFNNQKVTIEKER